MEYVMNTTWNVEDIVLPPYGPGLEDHLNSEYVEIHNWRYGNHPADNKYRDGLPKRVESFTFKLCQYLQLHDIDIRRLEIFIPTMLSEVVLSIYSKEGGPTKIYMLGHYRYLNCVPKYNVRPMGNVPDPYKVSGLVKSIHASMAYRECMKCYYSDDSNSFCGLGMKMNTQKCARYTPYAVNTVN